MTAKRQNFSLVCLPHNDERLIAIGGFNDNWLDVVECLGGEGATEWRRLAPLPIPLSSRGGVYFKHRILLVGGNTTDGANTSATVASQMVARDTLVNFEHKFLNKHGLKSGYVHLIHVEALPVSYLALTRQINECYMPRVFRSDITCV